MILPAKRRLAVLTQGRFGTIDAKTAAGLIRYARDPVVAVIDSVVPDRSVTAWLPGHDVPVLASLDEALALPEPPTALVIGIAPDGGRLPTSWRPTIRKALDAGLEVHAGLHEFLGDDPEFAADAARTGTRLVDYRRPPAERSTATGRLHRAGTRVVLAVGSDCAIGKMTVMLELQRAALAEGHRAAFVPTGQTGAMIAGGGVSVDAVVSDFLNGTVERMVDEAEAGAEWILIEGQGSLDHPAYSPVTLGLIHGSSPHAMVLVTKAGQTVHDLPPTAGRSFPIAPLGPFIGLHEQVAGLIAPSRVVAVAVNTAGCATTAEARTAIDAIGNETGLPTDDPVRFGPERLWGAVHDAVQALPWVQPAGQS
jgi:uncharacterized NAD-dependent epimerase/dehydratase family protein